jgi:uncharacterized membrane protein YkvA (DUF1232 family)
VRWLLIGIACTAVVWALAVAGLVIAGRRTQARELGKLLSNLISLFRGLRKDPAVPRGTKLLMLFALFWIASPIDLIPEFIPVLGPLDDVVVAALVLRRVIRSAGPDVVRAHWRGTEDSLRLLLRTAGVRGD